MYHYVVSIFSSKRYIHISLRKVSFIFAKGVKEERQVLNLSLFSSLLYYMYYIRIRVEMSESPNKWLSYAVFQHFGHFTLVQCSLYFSIVYTLF